MGVLTYESQISSPIPPARLFKGFILDFDTLVPKLLPQVIAGVQTIQGDGGPGTIKKINLGESSQFKVVKRRLDGLDKEKLTYNYSLFEGDFLGDKFELISYETKMEASADGGSVVKSITKYHTKGEYELKEEEIKAGQEKLAGVFKAVEAYLLANPDSYN